jgi:hypothetical protein
MKHLLTDSLIISTFLIALSTSIGRGTQSQFRTANSQAQNLVKIIRVNQSPNNSGLPVFYDCINENKLMLNAEVHKNAIPLKRNLQKIK